MGAIYLHLPNVPGMAEGPTKPDPSGPTHVEQ
jgi:hypothetical protein